MSASRAGRNAEPDFGGLLRRDQPVDDVAALHQQRDACLIDAVDLAAQVGKRGRGLGSVSHDGRFYLGHQAKSKKTLAQRPAPGPDLTRRPQCHYLWTIVVVNLSRSACKPR